MSQTVVTVDVGGTGANNANAALTNLGALPTFGGSISGNLNVAYRDWETDRKSTRLNSSH